MTWEKRQRDLQDTSLTPDVPRFHPGTIQTFSGEAYDFASPDPASIRLEDIAHALSNACRFAGHTSRFYSVAEHCVRVSRIIEYGHPGHAPVLGLMHDAHEAYVWDCPRPFKPLLGRVYEDFANKADAAIADRFNLRPEHFHLPLIKWADNVALVAEARLLMHYGPEEWTEWEKRYSDIPAPPEGTFSGTVGWSPEWAETKFLARAEEVGLCG